MTTAPDPAELARELRSWEQSSGGGVMTRPPTLPLYEALGQAADLLEQLASTMSAEEVRMRVARAMEKKLGDADIFKDDEEVYPDRFTDQNTNCGGGAGTVIVDGCINLLEMADAAIRAVKVMK